MRTILLKSFLSISLLNLWIGALANPVEYKACSPASGSEITSFDFELEFDISKALEAAEEKYPGENFGIGYVANANGEQRQATLYKGDALTGEVLGTAMTKLQNGKSEAFEVNGNRVRFAFDDAIPVVKGRQYTVTINNRFYLYREGKATNVSATQADFIDNPIVLKFVGGDVGDSRIYLDGCSVAEGNALKTIKTVEYRFSAPIAVVSDAQALLKDDNKVHASATLKVSAEDACVLLADFPEEVTLYNAHPYTLTLPKGAVSHAANPAAQNSEHTLGITGATSMTIPFVSSEVEFDEDRFPNAVVFYYDLPEGMKLMAKNNDQNYKGAVYTDAPEPVKEYTGSLVTVGEDGRSIRWLIQRTQWLPSTKYEFRKEATPFRVYDTEGELIGEFAIEAGSASFTTISVGEGGLAPPEMNCTLLTTATSKETEYTPDMEMEVLTGISFRAVDNFYVLNGVNFNLRPNPTYASGEGCELYEITPDGDRLLATYPIKINSNSSAMINGSCPVYVMPNVNIYAGKRYRLVIPEGYISANPDQYSAGLGQFDISKFNYICSRRMEFTFTGATEAKPVDPAYCSVEDGTTMEGIYKVVWRYSGPYRMKDGACATLTGKTSKGIAIESLDIPLRLFISSSANLVLDGVDKFTGKPIELLKDATYTLNVPKGTIINEFNEEVVNEEVTLHLIGAGLPVEPQTVNVNVSAGERQTSHDAVKGKTLSLEFAPADGWKVASVTNNGTKLMNVGTRWNTMPLNANANIVTRFEYVGPWAKELSPDAWEIENAGISISRDNEHIVVAGVTPEQTISVYTEEGSLISTAAAEDGKDNVRISVAGGSTYVVTVDGIAAKITMPGTSDAITALADEAEPHALLIACNVIDNSKTEWVHNIVWTFDGNYRLAEEGKILVDGKSGIGIAYQTSKKTPVITKRDGMTAVMVNFDDDVTGKGDKLTNNNVKWYTIPAGTLINEEDESVVNEEIVWYVHNTEDAPATPEAITVKVDVDGQASTHSAVNGKVFTLDLKPAAGWKVASVSNGDTPLTFHKGLWYTKPLSKDTEVKAHLEYAGPWAVEVSTGVWQVENTAILIHRDNDRIAVTGAPSGCVINVYTVGGTLIDSRRAEASDVRIPVAPGQTYIVTVDGTAAKLRM